jgi:hypothetical protein
MNPFHPPKRPNSREFSNQELSGATPAFRSAYGRGTGLVLAYPDGFYADAKGLILLAQVRKNLPVADYREGLPAEIMKCCTDVRNRDVLEGGTGLELTGTFDLGTHHVRFRVLSLPPKARTHRPRVLVLLDSIANDAACLVMIGQKTGRVV